MTSKLEELEAAYTAYVTAYAEAAAYAAYADAAYDAYVTAGAYVTELKRLQGGK